MRSRIFAAVSVLMLVILTASGQAAIASEVTGAPQGPLLEVVVNSGLLTVRANGARLADVLEAVGLKAQVTIVLGKALDALVSAASVDLPVDEGLRRLTRGQSLVMIYDSLPDALNGSVSDAASSPVLREVWVANPSRTRRAGVQAGQDTRSDVESQVGRPVVGTISTNITAALNQVNPETRKRTLEVLVREQGADVVVSALREEATVNARLFLRLRAIQTLESMHSADAIDALRAIVTTFRETATANPNPRIRRQAVSGLAEITGPEASEALSAALSDRNSAVATEARRALVRQSRRGAGE